ncbi:MAG: hypothetical protein H7A51_10715 [Akkermansiaceae bacterium]|nr:hypothetical protein [Akkermansiaceae bacterium]
MKIPGVCVLVVVVAVSLSSLAHAADWRVELVPSRHSEGKGQVLYATKPLDKFYIVLHNTSGQDQRVWRDWCPWGYHNLSLHAELDNGKKVLLTTATKNWGRSYPDAALVRAGKSYVFEVHLAGKVWKGLEELPGSAFKLTVVYEVKETAESKQKHVWTGKVSSEAVTVTVRK